MDINVNLNSISIGRAVAKLNRYAQAIETKANAICERLARYGAFEATAMFNQAIYDGEKIVDVRVDAFSEGDEKGFEIIANGETALILEFGAGVTYGYGHPLAGKFGMGPGTYPDGKGHWDSPNGWWFVDAFGKHHSYGNAPAMPMYNTAQDLRSMVEEVAREVLLND